MGIIQSLLNSRTVRNAVQQQIDGFKGYGSSQLNDYNGLITDVYTRDYMNFGGGGNRNGKYDNYYGDYNRIIQVAPTFPFYYVREDEIVDNGDFVKHLEEPNADFPQFKVWQQIYSELITHGHSDVFLWRKEGREETRIFDPKKKYPEENFRGITLVSGYDFSKFSDLDKKNIVRITYGVSQEDVFMGYSPSQAAQSWRKMQDEMGLHMTAFARNAGMPIGKFIITAPSPEEYAKLRENLSDKISGAKNSGKVLYDYRPSESKVSQIEWVQFTSQDVQDYTSQLEFSEKKMSQGFGVSGTVKGTNDGENYATARVSEHIFIKYTIKSLITDFQMQLYHALKRRFDLTGEIKVNIQLPEIADESKIKIEATKLQVELFDQKIAEGYTAQSIVDAYGLPESFLLLETGTEPSNQSNKARSAHKHAKSSVIRDEYDRQYKNQLSPADRDRLESSFTSIIQGYADEILRNGIDDASRIQFEQDMIDNFSVEYATLYGVSLDYVATALTDILETVDIAELNLTDDELLEAAEQYRQRVDAFSKSFTEIIDNLPGETLEVREKNSKAHVKLTAVTESEHARIVSELKSWTKAQEEFPVRVLKTWNTRPGACPECLALEDIQIDVTALFVNNPTNEIYEVQGGGAHPQCRCFVRYEMEKE